MIFFDSFRLVAHAWLWENKNDHHSDFQSSFSIRTSFGTEHNKHWELLYNHATHIKPQDWLSLFPVSTLLRMPHYLFIMARAIISQWPNPPASAFVSYAKHVHWFLFPGSVWVCVCVCMCVCRPQPGSHCEIWHIAAVQQHSLSCHVRITQFCHALSLFCCL